MQRNKRIELLLKRARDSAIRQMDGLTATEHNLKRLASLATSVVLTQAELGQWVEWGIKRAAQFQGLQCKAEIRRSLTKIPQINLVWDFSHTDLPLLEVR